MVSFVFHALRKRNPLIDLHLFLNRNLTVAVITMTLFIVAFMGAGLLFPSYFMQVREESTLMAGLLMAPQGIGAMITMPIAGRLTDKTGPGKLVLTGIVLIAVGMGTFTQLAADTSYVLLLGSLFVMGLGMGMTMMPIMTAALASLTHAEVARGSTLMNIVQQAGGSIGTATMSVILTNQILNNQAATAYNGVVQGVVPADQVPPEVLAAGQSGLAEAFGSTFTVAVVLVALCLIPALFLPRSKKALQTDTHGQEGDEDGDAAQAPPIVMH